MEIETHGDSTVKGIEVRVNGGGSISETVLHYLRQVEEGSLPQVRILTSGVAITIEKQYG